jgi:hypothetical protein
MTLTKFMMTQRNAATPAYLGSLGSTKQIGLVLLCRITKGGQGKLVWSVSCGFKGYFFN